MAITSIDDPRIAPYRFVRERDLHRVDGLFVAEGEVVVRRLLEGARFQAHSVLASEQRYAALAPALERHPDPPPIYVAPMPILSAIAGFPLHRGVIALAHRGEERNLDEALASLPARALLLVAIGIANHDNMGALFRNAAAFGVDLVVVDHTSCDPLYRKAIRVSVGAALQLPFVRVDAGHVIEALIARDVVPLALSPAGTTPLGTLSRPSRAALVVGAEGPGLPDTILSRVETVSIAMAAGWDSLNVATAAAIALNQLAGSGMDAPR